jgi:DNA-binding MarR family transcriptional regulator/predicted N-acetyltransferase YhbS
MDAGMVAQVRGFNRTVTERVGALQDRFLGRDRPLGASRLLWEIGPDGRDVRELRAGLGLDSGYLSRLLRSLEAAGLVEVAPAADDRRVRVARLTAAGGAERRTLDRDSDRAAAELLAPLAPEQRRRLVAAMTQVERLLRATSVRIDEADPASADARRCLAAYFAEIDDRFEGGFDAAASLPAGDAELRPPAGLLLVARLGADPVGCGALVFGGGTAQIETAQVKRMWVARSARGLGLGRRLLGELETRAAGRGARRVRLETNRALSEAIALYRSAGYVEVEPFNAERYAHHWFEKRLD